MSKKNIRSAIATAIGASFLAAAAASPVVNAAENPFSLKPLANGYKVAEKGSCGGKKKGSGDCSGKKGAGNCSGKKGSGDCSGKKADKDKKGKCGKGKCA